MLALLFVLLQRFAPGHAIRIKLEKGVEDCTVARFLDEYGYGEAEIDYHFFVEGKKNELNYDFLKSVIVKVYGPRSATDPPNVERVEIRKDINVYQEEYRRFKNKGAGDYYLCFEHHSPSFQTINVNLVYFNVRDGVDHTPRPPGGVATPILKNPKGTVEQRRLEVATMDDVKQVHNLAGRLKSWLDEIRYEQFYMKRRVETHKITQLSTHARTLFFSLGETSAIVLVSILQIVFFQRLFSHSGSRRMLNVPTAPIVSPQGGPLGSIATFASNANSMFGGAQPPSYGGGSNVRMGGRVVV